MNFHSIKVHLISINFISGLTPSKLEIVNVTFWVYANFTQVVCIDIALCVMVHDVKISPSSTTNYRWNSQSFEMNDAWKTVNHSIPGITHISDKIFRCS